MEGCIGAAIRRMDAEERIIIIITGARFPHSNIGGKTEDEKPTITIYVDADFYPGPPANFPEGDGLTDEQRRIIIMVHEFGHAILLFHDPENVNVENRARLQLGCPLRKTYDGKNILRLSDREQHKLDTIIDKYGKKPNNDPPVPPGAAQ